jgi:hypothetical protein
MPQRGFAQKFAEYDPTLKDIPPTSDVQKKFKPAGARPNYSIIFSTFFYFFFL